MVSKIKTLQEAIAQIPDGSSILFGGWTVARKPMAAVFELIRQGKKELHLLANPAGPCADLLIGAGAVKITETNFIGHEVLGIPYGFRRFFEKGGLDKTGFLHDDWTVMTGALRILAGSMGVPFIPAKSLRGTEIIDPEHDLLADLRGKSKKLPNKKVQFIEDPFWDEGELLLIPAIKPDYAIIHVQLVGDKGTVRIDGGNFLDYYAAAAAKHTIVTTELVTTEEYLQKHPELNSIPSEFVNDIVEVPYGGHPTVVHGAYDLDFEFYNKMVDATKKEETYQQWLQEWVKDVPDHMTYLEKLGVRKILALRSDPGLGYNAFLKRKP
ncbi:MAG: CoA-transferase [Clostridia bacterium]|jgi:glutaconate CoA-transferase subunit A|nr:CoA-transferase [Clostridia bacterium]